MSWCAVTCRINSAGLLDMSYAEFNVKELSSLGQFIIQILRLLRLAHFEKMDDGKRIKMNNLTLINFVLYIGGPRHERTLTVILLFIQVID